MWSFHSDTIHSWAYANEVFTPEQCDEIIDIAEQGGFDQGLTFDDNYKSQRNTLVYELQQNKKYSWIYERITDVTIHINERFFGFNTTGYGELLQIMKYVSPNGGHIPHIDRRLNFNIRKLSCVLMLSDPESYKGGSFKLIEDNNPITLPRERGTAFFFPSWAVHTVEPVTEGTRYSLVGWTTGPNFI